MTCILRPASPLLPMTHIDGLYDLYIVQTAIYDLYRFILWPVWFLWVKKIRRSNFTTCYCDSYEPHSLAVICGSMGVSHYDFVSLSSMTCISVFYDIVLSTKWCASLPFMTCCLWRLVWLPHMTPYSFKVYISRPVWFEFERIKTLKAIGCKVYDMLLGFLWLPSMTVWQCDFYGSRRFKVQIPEGILCLCTYVSMIARIYFYAMFLGQMHLKQ